MRSLLVNATRNPPERQPEPPRLPLSETGWLTLILAYGLVLRLALAPFGSYAYDTGYLRFWAARLVATPLAAFYATPELVDHLPGDMWILKLVATLYHLFSPAMAVNQPAFLIVLKLVPALADVGIALMLYLLARRLSNGRIGLIAAAGFIFNPAAIFLSAVWGQWESVPVFLLLAAFWLLLRGNPEWSLPVLTYTLLIQPLFAVFAVPFFSAFLIKYLLPHLGVARRAFGVYPMESLRRSLARLLVAALACAAILLVVLLPFNVSPLPLPHYWSLWDRIEYARNYYQSITMGAFNLWALFLNSALGTTPADSERWIFGLPVATIATAASVLTYAAVVAVYWLKPDVRTLLWLCLAVGLTAFMLPTRIHERYLMVSVVFAEVVALAAPKLCWCYLVLSLTNLINLLLVYNYYYPVLRPELFYSPDRLVHVVAAINVLVFLYVLIGMRGQVSANPLPVVRVPWTGDRGDWRGS